MRSTRVAPIIAFRSTDASSLSNFSASMSLTSACSNERLNSISVRYTSGDEASKRPLACISGVLWSWNFVCVSMLVSRDLDVVVVVVVVIENGQYRRCGSHKCWKLSNVIKIVG